MNVTRWSRSCHTHVNFQGKIPGKQLQRDILSAIKVCTSLRNLERAKRIHEFAVQAGVHSDVRVATGLVDMYSKCCSMPDARKVFDSIHRRDAVAWSSLITGYVTNGEAETALDLYFLTGRKDFVPTSRTILAALMACTSLAEEEKTKLVDGDFNTAGCLEKGIAIHVDVKKHGFDTNMIISNALMNLYTKCGSLADAREIFETMTQRSTVSWTTLILGYAEYGQSYTALELYERMQKEPECRPDSRTLVAVLTACVNLSEKEQTKELNGMAVKAASMEKAFALHAQASQAGFASDMYVATGLVNLYARCGSMRDARAVFDTTRLHDVVLFNGLINGYVENGEPELAFEVYTSMECSPDSRTFVAALSACSCFGERQRVAVRKPECLKGLHTADKSLKAQVASTVEEIHSEAEKLGLDIHLYVANALISTYASCGNMHSARDVFERLEQRQRDVVSWTALVLGYAENDQPEVALELFFKQMDVKPNHLTYTAGLAACMASAELQSGRKLHGHICRTGLESHVHLSAKLLEFYAKCGMVSTALHLFESVPYTSLDVSPWNTLLSAYSRQGDTNRAFHIFNMMRDQGLVPNGVTFLGLLTACSHAGLVDVGRKLFKEMHVELGFVPGLDHFHCVADMLARGNRLKEAVEMIQTMPFTADECSWTIILGGCYKWKNVELGRFAFEKLVEVKAEQPSAYVLMGNIYASAGMWEEKARVLSNLNSFTS